MKGRSRPGQGGSAKTTEALDVNTSVVSADDRSARVRARRVVMIDAACELALAGWRIFPCWPAGPRAKSPLTEHGHLDATMEPELIKEWWTRWPNAMIGAAVPDSCVVIDIDPRNGGSSEELETLVGPLPDTLTVWSGRNDGGRHLYFRRPAGELTGTRLPRGIDLKVRGYMIMPPSVHPVTGRPYRWERHPVAAVPTSLRKLLRPAPRPIYRGNGVPSGSGLVRKVASAEEGTRNNTLFWASLRAIDDGILDRIEEELIAAALAAGLAECEARGAIASARRSYVQEA
jgi:Bifunctional DNA primase/polymerase, N-terminal